MGLISWWPKVQADDVSFAVAVVVVVVAVVVVAVVVVAVVVAVMAVMAVATFLWAACSFSCGLWMLLVMNPQTFGVPFVLFWVEACR